MKPDAPAAATPQASRSPALSNRELSNPPSPATATAPGPPTSRPKLNLTKRTVSESIPDEAAASGSDSKASPFGAARPIDTASREKAVEEKRQIAVREKKEADEKARAEKKLAEEKSREEKKSGKDAEETGKSQQQVQSPREKPNGQKWERQDKAEKQDKENGVSGPAPGKQYEILRRNAGDDTSNADEEADEAEEADQNGLIVGDKDVKPREVVREPQSSNGGSDPVDTTATALEEDGWSRVPEKKRKNGNAAARALAS